MNVTYIPSGVGGRVVGVSFCFVFFSLPSVPFSRGNSMSEIKHHRAQFYQKH